MFGEKTRQQRQEQQQQQPLRLLLLLLLPPRHSNKIRGMFALMPFPASISRKKRARDKKREKEAFTLCFPCSTHPEFLFVEVTRAIFLARSHVSTLHPHGHSYSRKVAHRRFFSLHELTGYQCSESEPNERAKVRQNLCWTPRGIQTMELPSLRSTFYIYSTHVWLIEADVHFPSPPPFHAGNRIRPTYFPRTPRAVLERQRSRVVDLPPDEPRRSLPARREGEPEQHPADLGGPREGEKRGKSEEGKLPETPAETHLRWDSYYRVFDFFV